MATVRYLVDDVDASLPFYEALGFSVKERWGPPFVMLSRGDLELWLSGPGTSAARPLPDGSVPAPGGWNRLVIPVGDLGASMQALRAAQATFRSEPVQGPGGQQVLVEDPSGNPVELFEAAAHGGKSDVPSVSGGSTLYAKQLERVSRFYAEVCGLSTTVREREFVVLEKGPLQLVVVQIPEHIASTFEIATPPARREDAALKLVFVVDSIAVARASAREWGGVIDPVENEWQFQGMRVCDGHDPEGNVIQLRERP